MEIGFHLLEVKYTLDIHKERITFENFLFPYLLYRMSTNKFAFFQNLIKILVINEYI